MSQLNKLFLVIIGVLVLGLAGGVFFQWISAKNKANLQTKNQSQNRNANDISSQTLPPPLPETQNQPEQTKAEENKDQTPKPSNEDQNKDEPKAEEEEKPEPVKISGAPGFPTGFQWGVLMRPCAVGNYSAASWAEQVNKAKELGVGWTRIVYDYENANPFARNDAIIDALKAKGINTMLVIEHNPAKGTSNMYGQGYNDGFSIASHYRGKVSFYQLANEGSAQVVKSGNPIGDSKSDFDEGKYQELLGYLKGLSDGISKADPNATKVVSMVFTHTGYLDRLRDDGLDYDVIGIDWYDWMGAFSAKRLGSGQLLYDKLRSFGKPLEFVEINILPKVGPDGKMRDQVDEQHQADYITAVGDWAFNHRDWVKGFYVLELVDNVNNPSPYKEYFGLIKGVMTATGGSLGATRQAFGAYRDLIKSH